MVIAIIDIEVIKMTKAKAERKESKYSAFQNTGYLIKNLWKWDKILFLLCFLQLISTVVVPLFGIYIPKILIDSIANQVSVSRLMLNLGVPVIGMIGVNVLLNVSSSITEDRKISYRFKYIQLLMEKSIDTDFENIDGPSQQDKFMKASMAVMRNSSGTEAIISIAIDLASNILGLLLYAWIISFIHPLIVVFLILSSIMNYFVGKYVSKFEHKNKDNLAPVRRKLLYIMNKTGEFKSAKDMRLYNMFPWFKDMFSLMKNKRIYFEKKNIYRRYFANFVDGILLLLRDGWLNLWFPYIFGYI